jgi:hypothetical protein
MPARSPGSGRPGRPFDDAGDERADRAQGARTALRQRSGFCDVLELGHQQMYDIYDLFAPARNRSCPAAAA